MSSYESNPFIWWWYTQTIPQMMWTFLISVVRVRLPEICNDTSVNNSHQVKGERIWLLNIGSDTQKASHVDTSHQVP